MSVARNTLVDGELFLGGDVLEIGISNIGSFGTLGNAPEGFFGSLGSTQVGLVSDIDGFGVGEDLGIDFFIPGSPEERWSVGWNGTNFASFSALAGSTGSLTATSLADNSTADLLSGTFAGTVDETLVVEQGFTFTPDSDTFLQTISITNVTSDPLTDVLYMRSFDPDNTVFFGGGFTTINTVESTFANGDSAAIVSATSLPGDPYEIATGAQSQFLFFSNDLRAEVYANGFSNQNPNDFIDLDQAAGFSVTEDGAIGIIFELGDLESGESTTFEFSSSLSVADDTPVISIDATDAILLEGDAGNTDFTFTVTRDGDISESSSVDFAITGSGPNPADASDFGDILPSGTISFSADEASQVITVNVSSDTLIELDEEFTVTLSNADNASILTAMATGTILNDDVNSAPIITSAEIVSVPENDTVAQIITAIDDDGNPLMFSISGGADAAAFNIDAMGILTFLTAPDFEAPSDADGNNVFEVEVTVTDGADSTNQTLAITLTDVIDVVPILIVDDVGPNVEEGATLVTTFTAEADAEGPAPILTLEGPDAGLFAVDPDTNAVVFSTPQDFEMPGDVGSDNIFNITLVATDATEDTLVATEDIVVTLIDIVDVAPELIVDDVAPGVEEGETVATTFTAEANAGGPAPILTLEGPDAGLFAIDPDTNTLVFIAPQDFEIPGDADSDNIFNITLVATDATNDALVATEDIAVTLIDIVDAAPTLIVDDVVPSLAEGETFVTAFTAAADAGGPAPILTLEGPDAALFSISPDTNAVVFIAPQDFEAPSDVDGDNVFNITLVATDATNDTLVATENIIVTLTDIDDDIADSAPTLTAESVSVAENQTTATTAIATDTDDDDDDPVFSLEGPDAEFFAIDPATGVISFIAAPNFESPEDEDADNVFNLTVVATDGNDAVFSSEDINISVQDIAEPLIIEEAPSLLDNGILSFGGDFADFVNTDTFLQFTIGGDFGSAEIDGSVLELGVFAIDDTNGAVNGVLPADPNYLDAILTQIAAGNGEIVFSALPFQPNSFELGDLNRFVPAPGANLGFFLVPNGSIDNLDPDDIVLFSTLDENAFESANGVANLSFAGDDSEIFTDFSVDIQVVNATDIANAGDVDDIDLLVAGLQGDFESELLDLTDPNAIGPISVTATVFREADFDDLIGFFVVDNATGSIGNLTPGTTGFDPAAYIEAALTANLATGLDLLSTDDEASTTVTGIFDPGTILAPFIVVDGSIEDALNGNAEVFFPFIGANSDGADHVRLLGNNVFGFEDLAGGGDNDFNDVVVSLDFSVA